MLYLNDLNDYTNTIRFYNAILILYHFYIQASLIFVYVHLYSFNVGSKCGT